MLNRILISLAYLFSAKDFHLVNIFCKDKKPYLCLVKIIEMKRVIIAALLFFTAIGAQAQHLRAFTEYDYNRTERSRGNCAVAHDFQMADNVHLDWGFQIGTQNRYALNLAYQIDLLKARKGTLYLENRYLYRLFPSYHLQEFNALLDLGWRNTHWNFQFGLCNRYIAEIPLRKNGGEGVVFEPMNIAFNIEWNLFSQDHPWNIGCGLSNYREFIIERVTLFYYTLHGYYDLSDDWRLTAEAGMHPAGVLNLSSQRNGFFVNLGFIYNY